MTDLTDKWKKGELPSGYYYVKNEFGNIFPSDYSENYDCISDTVIKDFFTEVSEIKEVLEPVPSYEEYTKLKEELKDYEYQHKQDGICYDDIFCKLELARKENRQLKERLKKTQELELEVRKENARLKTDCRTVAQKLLQVKPELRDWLEVNYGEYL